MRAWKRIAALVLMLSMLCAGIVPAFAETAATPTDLSAADPAELEEVLSHFTLNHGPRSSKKIAITMDDVFETEWVWKSVELCRQYGITMTFFPIGRSLKDEDRDNWKAVLDAGC